MSLFICFIYGGGVTALHTRKIGFTRRIFWPMLLGRRLGAWAFATLERGDE